MDNNERIYSIINEELTKSDVNSMISSRLDSEMSSREFKKKVKELSAEVINDVFRILWQRNNFWKSASVK